MKAWCCTRASGGIEVTAEDDGAGCMYVWGAGVVWDDFVAYCVEQGLVWRGEPVADTR